MVWDANFTIVDNADIYISSKYILLLLIGEVYVLGWMGVLVLIVPLAIMFLFKDLEERNVFWGIAKILLMYGSIYGLMRWSLKLKKEKCELEIQ